MTDAAPHRPLSDILERLQDPELGGKVTIGELLDHFGRSTFGFVLALPALIAILPIVGALPGVSLTMAALALLLAGQMMFGLKRPWVPARIARISLPTGKLERGIEAVKPFVEWLERVFRPRLTVLTSNGFLWLNATLAIALAVAMTIGALVPGGIVPPAVAMLILSLGLTMRDGLLVLVSIIAFFALIGLGVWWLVL